jgi:hypothetical protein
MCHTLRANLLNGHWLKSSIKSCHGNHQWVLVKQPIKTFLRDQTSKTVLKHQLEYIEEKYLKFKNILMSLITDIYLLSNLCNTEDIENGFHYLMNKGTVITKLPNSEKCKIFGLMQHIRTYYFSDQYMGYLYIRI